MPPDELPDDDNALAELMEQMHAEDAQADVTSRVSGVSALSKCTNKTLQSLTIKYAEFVSRDCAKYPSIQAKFNCRISGGVGAFGSDRRIGGTETWSKRCSLLQCARLRLADTRTVDRGASLCVVALRLPFLTLFLCRREMRCSRAVDIEAHGYS